jgi:uncharacterized protein
MSEQKDGSIASPGVAPAGEAESADRDLPLWVAVVATPLILAAGISMASIAVAAARAILPPRFGLDDTFFGLLEALTGQVAIILLVATVLHRFQVGSMQWLRLEHSVGRISIYPRYFAAVVGLVGLYNVVLYLAFGHDPMVDLRSFLPVIQGRWWWLALIVIGIGAPLSEEILFRGFLMSALTRTSFGFWTAAVVTTSLWTALHFAYSVAGLLEVFAIGMVFSVMVRRTNSLRPAIFCHAAYNSALILGIRWLH